MKDFPPFLLFLLSLFCFLWGPVPEAMADGMDPPVPKVSEVPKIPEVVEVPEGSEVIVVPGNAEVPAIAAAPETPGVPEKTKDPKNSKEPEELGDSYVTYKDQDYSSIQWDKLNPDEWLDYTTWRKDLERRENDPLLVIRRRDDQHRELVGRVLSCITECRVYRGLGFVNASFRSSIREGDEIRTFDDSYAWIFLMDGTMIRLSPQTSVSFQEIDVGEKEIFLQVRLNEGFIYWLSRQGSPHVESELEETDPLFLPVRWYEANPLEQKAREYGEEELEKYLEEDPTRKRHIDRLNAAIEQNNKAMGKTTYSMLIMPNGTVYGRNLRLMAFSILTHESYIKQLPRKNIFLAEADPEKPDGDLEFYYRGYQNQESFTVKEGLWYKIDPRGKSIDEYEAGSKEFPIAELLVSRIPTLLLARELMLEHYSRPLFKTDMTVKELAKVHGYRLWGPLVANEEKKEGLGNLSRRVSFLKEYTRRIETTNLVQAFTLLKRLYGRKMASSPGYQNQFHQLAFTHYLNKISRGHVEEDLQSTHQKIWKMKRAAGNP